MVHWSKTVAGVAGVVALGASLSFAASAPKTSSHKAAKNSKSAHHARKKVVKPRGQQAIDGERCREIQQALVREHYMTGQPSGNWDDATQQAMRRYQADQGWQNKSVPDSRALIRLGLGPDHGHLLNPETAMTAQPQLPRGQARTRATSGAPASVAASRTQPSAQTGVAAQSSTAVPVSTSPAFPQR